VYEFIVLALLMAGPMHGYGIRQIVNRMIGPNRSVAWGPLYTTLRKLQEAGLIEAAPDETPYIDTGEYRGGPPSKHYRLTDAGRARFHQLIAVPREPEPEYDFLFGIKLARFRHVTPAERLALLRDYHEYCQSHLAHLAESSRAVATHEHMAPEDRHWILTSMDRWRAIWSADANWIERQLHLLEETGGEPSTNRHPWIRSDKREIDGASYEKGAPK
jgi:DNA-binding PadR family transcriptional regulator